MKKTILFLMVTMFGLGLFSNSYAGTQCIYLSNSTTDHIHVTNMGNNKTFTVTNSFALTEIASKLSVKDGDELYFNVKDSSGHYIGMETMKSSGGQITINMNITDGDVIHDYNSAGTYCGENFSNPT